MPEKLTVRCGEPVEFLLDGPCEQVPSNVNGTEWRYACNQGAAVIYLPRVGRDALLKANAQPGDLLRLEKIQRGKSSLFQVEVLPDAAEPQPARSPKSTSRDFAEQLARESSERRAWSQPHRHSKPAPEPANGNGHQQPPAAPAPAASDDDYLAHQYVNCFRSALKAARACMEEAKKFSYPCAAPSMEDVRTIATTFFIAEDRRSNGGAR